MKRIIFVIFATIIVATTYAQTNNQSAGQKQRVNDQKPQDPSHWLGKHKQRHHRPRPTAHGQRHVRNSSVDSNKSKK